VPSDWIGRFGRRLADSGERQRDTPKVQVQIARLEGFEPTPPGSEELREVYHLMLPNRKWCCAVYDEFHFRTWCGMW